MLQLILQLILHCLLKKTIYFPEIWEGLQPPPHNYAPGIVDSAMQPLHTLINRAHVDKIFDVF